MAGRIARVGTATRRKARHIWQYGIIIASALMMTGMAVQIGIGNVVERLVEPVRFAMLDHGVSGKLVIVEMDAASVKGIEQWPWPRDHHARVVDRLREMGAASIVFDVDFSSRSTPAGDAAFAAALKRAAGLVVLPTFSQQAGAGDSSALDTVPLPVFRENVALATVSVVADTDGLVRKAPFGTITHGLPRPSLSSYIAGRAGQADRMFPIDYSIRPDTIPRLSFLDVRDGKVDPAKVRGRTMLIGATAIEMGDRYAVPAWGVVPGVVVQALAAETLIAGVPQPASGGLIVGLAVLLSLGIISRKRGYAIALTALAAVAILIAVTLHAQQTAMVVHPLAPGLLMLGQVTLISSIRRSLLAFRRQRVVDEETGLSNKRAMLAAAGAESDALVIVADLANLESVAAVLGPDALPDLVRRSADRLRLAAHGSRVFKIGEKLLAFHIASNADVDDLLSGLRTVLQQPLEVDGRKIDLAISLGAARPGKSGLETALSKATLAAEKAVAQGAFWMEADPDIEELDRSISLMAELDEALDRGHICAHYQPKLSLASNQVVSVEALARWLHPSRGMIRPDHFIPLAERTGRVTRLTEYILSQVMRDLAGWRAAGHEISAAVNISARLLTSESFKAQVLAMLECAPVPSSALIFEITESATLDDPEAAAKALGEFRARGVTISIDDYGTGQSSLSYLRKLPLSELKIDRSFVEHAHHNRNDAVMVRSTVALAHDLGLKVVAEGVETEAGLAFLRSVGCDMAQGYLISRPVPPEGIPALLGRTFGKQAA